MEKRIKLIECPRDAMQGLSYFIPTSTKIEYLQTLLEVGFDIIDFGSFVSAKAIPQMADTHELIQSIVDKPKNTQLLAIIANARGAREAIEYTAINCLGFPFSVSETFQMRNTNSTIEQSVDRVKEISELCNKGGKELVIYLSMAFGNPYGDPWNSDILGKYIELLKSINCKTFALSDTIGIASPESIEYIFESLIPSFPELEIGAHLHTSPASWKEKISAAVSAGCRRFDGVIRGYGGCPMAKDELTGNMPMENLIQYFEEEGYSTNVNREKFRKAFEMANSVFQITHNKD